MDNGREYYGFTWPGKGEAVKEAGRPVDKVLRPCVEESVNFAETGNLYIEGDNLEALKVLQKSYMRRVKMIYIDPPYNTGHDFIYADDFSLSEGEFRGQVSFEDEGGRNFSLRNYRENVKSNPRYHSDWCNMIYPRLRAAHSLLRDDGVIFISIDDNEVAKLRMICDEIFGENNFAAMLAVKRRGARADSKYYASIHEYILCYAKNIESFEVGEKVKEEDSYPKYDEAAKRYYKTQLLRKWGTNSRREDRPNLFYPITAPDGSEVYPMLPDGREGCWRWHRGTMDEAKKNGRVEFVRQGDSWTAYEKIFAPLEGEERTQKYTTWLDDIPSGADTLKKLAIPFSFPKSTELITRLMEMAGIKDDSIVLDFFAGSSTTAHAVLSLNHSDNGRRKFIMVQLPEPCPPDSEASHAGYHTISAIGKERIRRASHNLSGDTGFRVLKLDTTNFRPVFTSPDDFTPEILDSLTDNIKPDRSNLDLLFMSITDAGLPLSLKYSHEEVDGFTIHTYGEGEIVACFGENLSEEVVRNIAKRKAKRVIFRDSGFAGACERINLEQIFRHYSPDSDLYIL